MFTNGKTNILGFSSQSVLAIAIVLMLFGIRSILRYVLIVLIGCSIFFISKVNDAMGAWGMFYIIFAFGSFLIQAYTNILPSSIFENKHYFVESNDNNVKADYQQFPDLNN